MSAFNGGFAYWDSGLRPVERPQDQIQRAHINREPRGNALKYRGFVLHSGSIMRAAVMAGSPPHRRPGYKR